MALATTPDKLLHDANANATTLMAQGTEALHDHVSAVFEAAMRTPMPQMEVRFEHLSLTAEVALATEDQQASHELPTLPNTVKKALKGLRAQKFTGTKHILRNLSGVLKPGTMTLILAQPGSGKSALMKVLAGRFPMTKNVKLEGEISFNGKPQGPMLDRLPQIVGYVPQHDEHFPTLTVKETLEFAHTCCGGGMPHNAEQLFANGTPDEQQAALDTARAVFDNSADLTIQQLGIDNCQNTVVGDAMLRGISGGECKRLTLGEMATGDKNVLLMDEISTGLDSAATFDIIKAHRSLAKKFRKTIVMALLQPAPEVFELFDDILILNDGYIMYHGPRDHAVEYFERLGFQCPPHRDVADFLMDLGTRQQRQYEVDRQDGKLAPRTAREFSDVFEISALHVATLRDLATPVEPQLIEDNARYFDHIPAFYQSFWASTRALIARQMTITFRNRVFIRGRVMMVVIMGLLYATVFWQLDIKKVQVVLGVLFVSILYLAFGQSTQIPMIMEARDKFYKHRGANFYRTSSYVVASSVAQIPMCIAETLIFGSLLYWMCGFVSSAKLYLEFEALIFVTVLCFASYYFFVSAIAPNVNIAKPISMVSVLFFNLFAGFVMSRKQIPDYFIWIYWIDPLAWGMRALAVSQYRDGQFEVDEMDGINYMKRYGKQMGEYSLSLYDVPSGKEWVWLGFAFTLGAYVLFMVLSCLVLEYKRYESPENVTIDSSEDVEPSGERMSTSSDNSSVGYAMMATPRSTDHGDVAVAVLPSEAHAQHFVPVAIAFKDLWYSVPDPQNPKQSLDLLKGVSGFALPGKITALMGSTGAGKTTLMDVIAGRKTGGTIRGEILLNGHPATDLAIRRSTGYCEQKDIHSDGATIREALTFSAFLRQGSDVPDDHKRESVEECLDLLDLHPIADQIIRGSSVEQMKRLTIGVELAAQPSVLFLDEPTSGLDARSAKTIMDGVRKVADTGRTVVCTIHQPSWKVFQVFDSLLLLKMGGQTVYFGDLGEKARSLVAYFEAIPGTRPIEKGANPATWMLEVIGAGVGNNQGRDIDFVGAFEASSKKEYMQHMLEQGGIGCVSNDIPELEFKGKRAASEWTQMWFLTRRYMQMYWRTPSYNLTRVALTLLLSLVFGFSFMNVTYTSYQGINSGQGMVAMTTIFIGMVSFFSVLPTISEDRAAYYRERASQTYNALWYFVGSTIAELPFVFGCALLFTAVLFPMVGFSGLSRFVLYWLGLSLHLLMQTYQGMFLVYLLPNVETAMVLGVLLNSIFLLFMGFNPPASSIPSAYKWLYDIAPHRYSLATLSSIVFTDCPDPTSSYLACQPLSNLPPTLPSHLTVKQYIESIFGMKHDELARTFGILTAWIVIFRVAGLLALRYINHQKK